MDETTTEATVDTGVTTINGIQVDDQGMAVAQPEEAETAEAVETNEVEVTETNEEPEVEKEVSTDDNSEWFKAKGIDPADPDAINKLAKSAREAERAMHEKAQKASELEKTLDSMSDQSAEATAEATGQDPELLKRVNRMEVRDAKRTFFDANPDAKKYEAQMVGIIGDLGLSGSADKMLQASYAIALSQDNSVASQAKRETLESLAQKQQASVPTGNATTVGATSQQITPENVDYLVGQNDLNWYVKNQKQINQAMSGQ